MPRLSSVAAGAHRWREPTGMEGRPTDFNDGLAGPSLFAKKIGGLPLGIGRTLDFQNFPCVV